jgi:hypothetical protein
MRDTARIDVPSTSAALSTLPVMDPADLLQKELKNQKMVLLSKEKKRATIRKCRVC